MHLFRFKSIEYGEIKKKAVELKCLKIPSMVSSADTIDQKSDIHFN